MNEFGISLYLGTGFEKNKEIIKKAHENNAKYAFTSLHIPEETVADYQSEVKRLLGLCKENNLSLIVDVGPRTLDKLGYKSFEELKSTSITHLRLDYGFSNEEIVKLSRDFKIVFNASTIKDDDLKELEQLGADFSEFYACHNFYPKEYTGLSLNSIAKINSRLKRFGFNTIAFVAGDKEVRGPLFEGLPTCEEHRHQDFLLSILQLIKIAETDICMFGDIDIKDDSWKSMKNLSENFVEIHADIDDEYSYVRDMIHHDRPDSSDYVIRSQESRNYILEGRKFPASNVKKRAKGSISISNEKYLRYAGELEIARKDLRTEERVNIIGQIWDDDLKYLNYITEGMGVKLISNK
ncbi:MupG family TIM beta-alpha barrel fold protein [Inconstantimicrobium porci]|uniref:MupG family TIM beta-alpha barrel fold protein n=1 Tax=Inconstantimicrobium porci TaxID=2652291 RepID=UPI002409F14A|nr:MupG family TIM beta-alpha barrel fold protein [Inconstantimicrobium porci]MDD6770164.1 MupG family TIM beta-alpha barrel fold protein [Inconstantimicrobium porci]